MNFLNVNHGDVNRRGQIYTRYINVSCVIYLELAE